MKKLKNKIIAVDLDGVLTVDDYINYDNYFDLTGKQIREIYLHKKPNRHMIRKINALAKCNVVYIFTSRDYNYIKTTRFWLFKNDVKYAHLVMNKPYYDLLIDDKAVSTI